jgi:hypothetical protein
VFCYSCINRLKQNKLWQWEQNTTPSVMAIVQHDYPATRLYTSEADYREDAAWSCGRSAVLSAVVAAKQPQRVELLLLSHLPAPSLQKWPLCSPILQVRKDGEGWWSISIAKPPDPPHIHSLPMRLRVELKYLSSQAGRSTLGIFVASFQCASFKS